MEVIIGIILFLVLIGVFLNWGIWILWSISVWESMPPLLSILTLLILFLLWLQPHPIPRKALIWLLAIFQIFSIFEKPEYFYFPLVNIIGLYALYRYSLVSDLKYYFKYEHQMSYDEAKKTIKKEKIKKFFAKSLPMSIINFSIFPGLGYLLVLPFRKQIDNQLSNYFGTHNVNESVALIDSITDRAIDIRYKVMGAYFFISLLFLYFKHNYSISLYLYLFNPIRGIIWLWNTIFSHSSYYF